jgi:hypothetical protein
MVSLQRGVLLAADFGGCLAVLQEYPPVDVHHLLEAAESARKREVEALEKQKAGQLRKARLQALFRRRGGPASSTASDVSVASSASASAAASGIRRPNSWSATNALSGAFPSSTPGARAASVSAVVPSPLAVPPRRGVFATKAAAAVAVGTRSIRQGGKALLQSVKSFGASLDAPPRRLPVPVSRGTSGGSVGGGLQRGFVAPRGAVVEEEMKSMRRQAARTEEGE